MGGEDFKETGMFFYCTCDDMRQMDKKEIMFWFENAKKIVLDDGGEFPIAAISPMISFTGVGTALIKVDAKDMPAGIYPTTATIH